MQNLINNIEQTLQQHLSNEAASEISKEVLASGFRGTNILAFDLQDFIVDYLPEAQAKAVTRQCLLNLAGEPIAQA
jgi:hypothetical protein